LGAHFLVDGFLFLWKTALQYSDLALRFSISLVLAFWGGQWLENKFQLSYLAVSLVALLGPLFFWRLMLGLEKLQENDT
jgi:hypothetical protein